MRTDQNGTEHPTGNDVPTLERSAHINGCADCQRYFGPEILSFARGMVEYARH